MPTLNYTTTASRDLADILDYLDEVAGERTANRYAGRFADALEQISDMPASGTLRPYLGADTRIVIVLPYILIYDFREEDDHLMLLRVVHGKQDINQNILK